MLQFVLKALDHMDTIVRALDNQVYFDFTCLQNFLDSNQQNLDCDPELLTIFVQEAETSCIQCRELLQQASTRCCAERGAKPCEY